MPREPRCPSTTYMGSVAWSTYWTGAIRFLQGWLMEPSICTPDSTRPTLICLNVSLESDEMA